MDLIIKNGTIVTPADTFQADLGIKDGIIVEIAQHIEPKEHTEVIDATSYFVLPGIIDAHVHLGLPMGNTVSNDDFANGTKAAACGGVTSVIDFATQQPGKKMMDEVHARRQEADGKVCIDYGLHAGITDWEIASQELDEAWKEGICSFKMFMTYKQRGLMSDDAALFQAMEEMGKRQGIISVHAESSPVLDILVERYRNNQYKYDVHAHNLSRPDIIEIEAIERAIRWAELSNGRLYIVHMTTKEGCQLVRNAREKGIHVYAETCPQYLFLDDSVFDREDGYLYTSCPQIKSKQNQEGLWKGLFNKDISVIATDHCTFTKAQKDLWEGDITKLPFGVPSIETMLSLVYTVGVLQKGMSLNHLVQVLSYNPARIYGLYPHKGTIAIGTDADVVLFDPNKTAIIDYKNLQTNCDWSPYQGMEVKGMPKMTISHGKIVAKDGKFIGEEGKGKYLYRYKSLDV